MKTILKYIIIGVFCTLIIAGATFPYWTKEILNVKIVEKERVQNDGSSKYLIFTDVEVFENVDSFRMLKFNSSDFYKDLEIGKQFKVQVYGFRIPLLSMYRNIYGFETL